MRNTQIDIILTALRCSTKTEDFMFQNVAYKQTAYKTGTAIVVYNLSCFSILNLKKNT